MHGISQIKKRNLWRATIPYIPKRKTTLNSKLLYYLFLESYHGFTDNKTKKPMESHDSLCLEERKSTLNSKPWRRQCETHCAIFFKKTQQFTDKEKKSGES